MATDASLAEQALDTSNLLACRSLCAKAMTSLAGQLMLGSRCEVCMAGICCGLHWLPPSRSCLARVKDERHQTPPWCTGPWAASGYKSVSCYRKDLQIHHLLQALHCILSLCTPTPLSTTPNLTLQAEHRPSPLSACRFQRVQTAAPVCG